VKASIPANQSGSANPDIIAVAVVFVVMLLSFFGYNAGRTQGTEWGHQLLPALFGTTYFLSVAFGTLYIYTAAYLQKRSLPVRIGLCLINPFVWMTKEVFWLTQAHPIEQCLYWYLNPLNIWLLSLMILEMGVATLIGRSVLKRSDNSIVVFTRGPVMTIVGALAFVITAYAWGKGENLYVLFLGGFRVLYGSGI
jgi:hypothetical protein